MENSKMVSDQSVKAPFVARGARLTENIIPSDLVKAKSQASGSTPKAYRFFSATSNTPSKSPTPATARPLGVRVRDLPQAVTKPSIPSQSYKPAPVIGQKRSSPAVIDLTGDDDDDDEDEIIRPSCKKSRTSSSSNSSLASEKVDRQTSQRPDQSSPSTDRPANLDEISQDAHAPRLRLTFNNKHPQPKVVVPPARPLLTQIELAHRQRFLDTLRAIPNITFRNDVDNSSPPADFQFIAESVLRDGVSRASEDFNLGCTCRKNRGPSLECRYPGECSCIQDSEFMRAGKKGYAYHNTADKRGCLIKQYLESRFHVFECNPKCDCSDQCRNRVVQHGRMIKVELFKTKDRGWGLRTMQHLQRGQFIDTYRGEIITHEEAERRNAHRPHPDEDIYLFDFDKWTQPNDEPPRYVCDGKHFGGPTRFMNHSCEPNCRLFTVSFNHADSHLYELAFFAVRDIAKGEELTFDYLDQDVVDNADDAGEEEDQYQYQDSGEGETGAGVGEGVKITEEMAKRHELEKGYAPSKCRCGSKRCRGYFFFSPSAGK